MQPIFITMAQGSKRTHEVIPFSVSIGAEEMYNYLLCQEENPETHLSEARAYLLHRIESINISGSKTGIETDVILISI